jgi:hypothetical protein
MTLIPLLIFEVQARHLQPPVVEMRWETQWECAMNAPIAGLQPEDCPVKPGLRIHRNYHHFLNVPCVHEVGGYARAAGGYLVPVKLKNGWIRKSRCALLRHLREEHGAIAFDFVKEVHRENVNVRALLRSSHRVPTVIESEDPGTLCLLVSDLERIHDEDVEVLYQLHINGLLGNSGKPDRVVPHTWA